MKKLTSSCFIFLIVLINGNLLHAQEKMRLYLTGPYSPQDTIFPILSKTPDTSGQVYQWNVPTGFTLSVISNEYILTEDIEGQEFAIHFHCASAGFSHRVFFVVLTINHESAFVHPFLVEGSIYEPYPTPANFFVDSLVTASAGDTLALLIGSSANSFNNAGVLWGTGVDSYIELPKSCNSTQYIEQSICNGDSIIIGSNVYTDSGHYVDTLVSGQGCDSIINLELAILSSVEITDTLIVDDSGSDNGMIAITIAGGMPPYSFEWSNGMATQNINDLQAGIYTLIITDSADCISEFAFDVNLATSATEHNFLDIQALVFPNPVKANEPVSISFITKQSQALHMQVFNLVGTLCREETIYLQSGKQAYSTKAPKTPGIYMIRIFTSEGFERIFNQIVK